MFHALSTPAKYFVSGVEIFGLFCRSFSSQVWKCFIFRTTKSWRNCWSRQRFVTSDRETGVLSSRTRGVSTDEAPSAPPNTCPTRHGRKLSKLLWKDFISGVEIFHLWDRNVPFLFLSYSTIEMKNFHTSDKKFLQQNRKVKKIFKCSCGNFHLKVRKIFISRKEKL